MCPTRLQVPICAIKFFFIFILCYWHSLHKIVSRQRKLKEKVDYEINLKHCRLDPQMVYQCSFINQHSSIDINEATSIYTNCGSCQVS